MIRIEDEISALHPALAGHFPGNPIVPGALLLSRIARAAAAAFGAAVGGVPAAKFLAPLRPGERFAMELEPAPRSTLRFRVLRGKTLVASGTLRLGRTSSA